MSVSGQQEEAWGLASTLLLLPGVVLMMLQTPGWDVSIYRSQAGDDHWKSSLSLRPEDVLLPRMGGKLRGIPQASWDSLEPNRVVVAGSLCSAPHL